MSSDVFTYYMGLLDGNEQEKEGAIMGAASESRLSDEEVEKLFEHFIETKPKLSLFSSALGRLEYFRLVLVGKLKKEHLTKLTVTPVVE